MSLDFPATASALWNIYQQTGVRPEYLLPVLYLESNFNPAIVNSIGCAGLNQLCSMNYWMMGTDLSTYRSYTASQQLQTGVLTYIKGVAGKVHSATMMQAAQFGQSKVDHIHSLDDVVLQPGNENRQNPGFDTTGKGYATAGDIASKLAQLAAYPAVQQAISQTYALAPAGVGPEQDPVYGTDFSPPGALPTLVPAPSQWQQTVAFGLAGALIGAVGYLGYNAWIKPRLGRQTYAAENPRQTFLDTPEDMQWLRDVHLPGLPTEYVVAVLKGNEDCPDQIDVYTANDVRAHRATYKRDKQCRYHLIKRVIYRGGRPVLRTMLPA